MSSRLIALLMVAFGLLALIAIAVSANLALRVVPAAGEPSERIAARAENYARTLVAVQQEGERFERVDALSTGRALHFLGKQAALEPAAQPTLRYIDGKFITRFRHGDRALVEARYRIELDGQEAEVNELYEFLFEGDAWRVELVQRLLPSPSGPIVPQPTDEQPAPTEQLAPTEPPSPPASP